MKNGKSGSRIWVLFLLGNIVLTSCATSGKGAAASTTSEVNTTPSTASQTEDGSLGGAAEPVSSPTEATPSKSKDVERRVANTELAKKNESLNEALSETKTVRFEWCPKDKVKASYELPEAADQHRVVFPAGLVKGKSYPVVVAFHGQPKRGKNPRDYTFMAPVQNKILAMVDAKEIQPVILVMPAFRFLGSNWPWFHPARFKEKVSEIIETAGFSGSDWYAFGHSGAAGCGGAGLNHIHVMNPAGVGFFDTCLGTGWQKEIGALQKAGIKTFNIHSVETAGFKPKQRPEYQANFDFGRAYSPLGIEPVACPKKIPGPQLRTLKHRCSATKDGVIQSFVIDTGQGQEAHKNILDPAIEFFLGYFLGGK